ncbi:NUDIX domain-containing protein [Amycolatopsis sp. NPDC004079]|uniref:NUDIX domain-containing protein n=1 Tax=Amycolatopsis sp. NPDC004079 TaxID=3154549 RepID=UPI0033ABDCC8
MAAKVALFAEEDGVAHVLRVTRAHPPFDGGPALPGGRVRPGEPSSAAAVRILGEETGIEIGEDVLYPLQGALAAPGYRADGYSGLLPPIRPASPGGDVADATWVPIYEAHSVDRPLQDDDGDFYMMARGN